MKPAVLLALLLGLFASLGAADAPGVAAPESYRLMVRDQLSVGVYDEAELASTPGIDLNGMVRLPLLDNVSLVGLTVREAERKIEQLLVEREFLKKPMVTIRILAYASREVRVLGPGVRPGGAVPFPPEIATMDIVEVITKAGGFTGIAKSREVMVTRRGPNGTKTSTHDVKRMIEDGAERFFLLPGDEIFVGEKFF